MSPAERDARTTKHLAQLGVALMSFGVALMGLMIGFQFLIWGDLKSLESKVDVIERDIAEIRDEIPRRAANRTARALVY